MKQHLQSNKSDKDIVEENEILVNNFKYNSYFNRRISMPIQSFLKYRRNIHICDESRKVGYEILEFL